jgi:hypothetical protein
MSINSAAGWLVAVFSLVSSEIEVVVTPVMASPLFEAGVVIQPCACAVTFTST